MVKESMRDVQNRLVDQYLTQRNRQKIIDERDPIAKVCRDTIDDVLRPMLKETLREVMRGVVFDTLIEAQFIKIFSSFFLKNQVKTVCLEAISEAAIIDATDRLSEEVVSEMIPQIAMEQINEANER